MARTNQGIRPVKILYGYPWYPSQAYGDVRQMTFDHIHRLRAGGFDVTPFCLTLGPPAGCLSFEEMDRMWRRGDRALLGMYEALIRALEGHDVLFNAAGINLHPEFVAQIPALTVFGFNDDPESSHQSKPVAPAYDLCLVGNVAEVETYRAWGCKNVQWQPMGLQPGYWDTSLTKDAILSGERDIDLFMMSDRQFPVRKTRLDQLAKAFPTGYFFGNGWPRGYLPSGGEVSWLRRAKIGPNIHNSTGPINFRTFYLPANGVLQICDNKAHLGQVYELGKEVVGFDTIDECIDACRYYLAHDEERRQIAANGWERAVCDYNEIAVFRRAVAYAQPLLAARRAPRDALGLIQSVRTATRWVGLVDSGARQGQILNKRARRVARQILNGMSRIGAPSAQVAAPTPAPTPDNDVRLICYEDVDAWILGKFAKHLEEDLSTMGISVDIAKEGNPRAAVGHHIIYYDAVRKWSPIETVMITHIDADWKLDKLRQQLMMYDMGVCMSADTREQLIARGLPAARLCYVNPAQDGVIKPRPLVLGIASKVHDDGRKKSQTIVEVLARFPTTAFALKIMGGGWDREVEALRASGYSVDYAPRFDYDTYVRSFMPSLDYFLYFSHDEGSMAYLDALAADVKTIITPQGFHLDVEGGVDHPIHDGGDLATVLDELHRARVVRSQRVASWTWAEYAWRHNILWEYLRETGSSALVSEALSFDRKLPEFGVEHASLKEELHAPVPASEALTVAARIAGEAGLLRLAAQLARQGLVFYPKDTEFKGIISKTIYETAPAGHGSALRPAH